MKYLHDPDKIRRLTRKLYVFSTEQELADYAEFMVRKKYQLNRGRSRARHLSAKADERRNTRNAWRMQLHYNHQRHVREKLERKNGKVAQAPRLSARPQLHAVTKTLS